VISSINRPVLYLTVDFFIEARQSTNLTSTVIEDLDSCETYLIDVGLVSPQGVGPLTESPKQIITRMDENAPPKDVKIVEIGSNMQVRVTWKAPCPVLETPLSYNVSISNYGDRTRRENRYV